MNRRQRQSRPYPQARTAGIPVSGLLAARGLTVHVHSVRDRVVTMAADLQDVAWLRLDAAHILEAVCPLNEPVIRVGSAFDTPPANSCADSAGPYLWPWMNDPPTRVRSSPTSTTCWPRPTAPTWPS